VVEALPRNAMGKVVRADLVRAASESDAGGGESLLGPEQT
jgi:acyl-coenzyme A synthetase/AMP-(fatty) acid ligase